MSDKPNKPGSDFDAEGEDQAVKNQSTVTPDDYPDAEGGYPDTTEKDVI